MIVAKEKWSALPTRRGILFRGDRKALVHHVASAASVEHADCPKAVRMLQSEHIHYRGWTDIGFNWVVCSHGIVYEGRGERYRPTVNGDNKSNSDFYAVGVFGDQLSGDAKEILETEANISLDLESENEEKSNLWSKTNSQLRDLLSQQGLSTSGAKEVLVNRLLEAEVTEETSDESAHEEHEEYEETEHPEVYDTVEDHI